MLALIGLLRIEGSGDVRQAFQRDTSDNGVWSSIGTGWQHGDVWLLANVRTASDPNPTHPGWAASARQIEQKLEDAQSHYCPPRRQR